MSQWGTILDVLATMATGVVTNSKSTRGIPHQKLRDEDYPHIFLWSATEDTEQISGGEMWRQEKRVYRALIQLILKGEGDLQEQLYLDLDAIRDAIHADHRLNSNVHWAFVEFREPHEEPRGDKWIGNIGVYTEVVAT